MSVSVETIAEVLSRTDLLSNVSEESRRLLAEVCLPKAYDKRQTLFVEGRKGMAVHILASGSVQLYKSLPDGGRSVVKLVKPGEMFGEVILFEQESYPVSAVALAYSQTYLISRHQFLCLLERRDFRDEFIGSLMRKMRYLADRIRYLTAFEVEQKLLLFLEEHYGRRERIVLSLSKKNVAATICVTPETLSRTLVQLKKKGLLVWEGDTITVAPAAWERTKRPE